MHYKARLDQKDNEILQQLYPSDNLKKKAKIDEILQKSFAFHQNVGPAIAGRFLLMVEPWKSNIAQAPAVQQRIQEMKTSIGPATESLFKMLATYEQQYADRSFSTEKFNLADLIVLEEVMTVVLIHHQASWEKFPNLKMAYDEYAKLEHFEEVHQEFIEFAEANFSKSG